MSELLISRRRSRSPRARLWIRTFADLHRRFTLNSTTHLELAHGFGRRFVQRSGGAMLLVSALGATHGLPNMAHDGAAKAYVLNLGEALNHELRRAGIKVTVMMPGSVDTPVIDALGLDRNRLPLSPLPVRSAIRQTIRALRAGHATIVPEPASARAGPPDPTQALNHDERPHARPRGRQPGRRASR